MSELYICEKCNSSNVKKKKNKHMLLTTQPSFTTMEVPGSLRDINLTRCICCNCGYIWICIDNKKDLKRLEEGCNR